MIKQLILAIIKDWHESPIEQHQRNSLIKGIKDAKDSDFIILSDIR